MLCVFVKFTFIRRTLAYINSDNLIRFHWFYLLLKQKSMIVFTANDLFYEGAESTQIKM